MCEFGFKYLLCRVIMSFKKDYAVMLDEQQCSKWKSPFDFRWRNILTEGCRLSLNGRKGFTIFKYLCSTFNIIISCTSLLLTIIQFGIIIKNNNNSVGIIKRRIQYMTRNRFYIILIVSVVIIMFKIIMSLIIRPLITLFIVG